MSATKTPTPLTTDRQDLAGKVAIITAASKGIGRATALNLASRGCSILGTCSNPSTVSLIESLATEINHLYQTSNNTLSIPKVIGIPANILSPTSPTTIADALQQHFDGTVDIFINNAAAVDRTPVGGLELQSVENVLTGNVRFPALTIDILVSRKAFRKNSRIIFISSTESTRCDPSA